MNDRIRNRLPEATERARRLRRESGVSERLLWEILRNGRLGFKFRRQVPVGAFTLDFYCPAAKVCVEVDGELHGLRQDRDAVRDQRLDEMGIRTVRVPSLLLFVGKSEEVEAFFAELIRLCAARTGKRAGQ